MMSHTARIAEMYATIQAADFGTISEKLEVEGLPLYVTFDRYNKLRTHLTMKHGEAVMYVTFETVGELMQAQVSIPDPMPQFFTEILAYFGIKP